MESESTVLLDAAKSAQFDDIDLERARQLYSEVIQKYPGSDDAELAKGLLDKIQFPKEEILPERKKKPPVVVQVVSFDMGFFSLVMFMVKAAIAAIPALIILAVLWLMVGGVIMGVINGIGS